MSEKPITILMADDHQLFRAGLISLLKDDKEILFIGEAANGDEMIHKYFDLKPDLILIDISMPELSGTMALKEIRALDPKARALFLTMYEGEEYIFYTMKLGGRGLVNKNVMKGELIYAIKEVHAGRRYFGRGYNEAQLEELSIRYEHLAIATIDQYTRLSPKERDVLKLIAEGITSAQMAVKLGISKRTVDSHRHNLMDKLKLKSLPELIAYSIRFTMANKLLMKD